MQANTEMLKSGRSVAAVMAAAELDPEAMDAAGGAANPQALVAVWVDGGRSSEAVGFLAHALPTREGIWWAWLCAREAAGETPTPEAGAILGAVHDWIAAPADDRRRRAFALAEEGGLDTAGGLAALAVFLSGGSLAPEGVAPVSPGPFDAARAVAGAVALAAVAVRPDDAPGAFREFVEKGLALAERIELWTPEMRS